MKPITLTLCGWGPFRDSQTVDFTKLSENGIFLITGQTGAGKTTVFDGITYALYGNMSGEIREKNSVRSDFAEDDTPTFAELVMQHNGEVYRIYRNPEYMRPKKRKNGKAAMTKEREKAVLTLPDGTAVEGSSEVTRKIQEILRLDYRQFKQISMIAQGEFARLLTASPNEKTRIFREIFDTALYDRFAARLREDANNLYKEVMEYRHRMDEDVRQFSTEDEIWKELTEGGGYSYELLMERLGQLEKQYREAEKAAGKQAEKVDRELVELEKQMEQAESIRKSFARLQETREKLERLKEKAEEMKQEEERLKRAEHAAEIRAEYQLVNSLEKQVAALSRQQQAEQEAIVRDEAGLASCREFYENRERLLVFYDIIQAQAEQKARQEAGEKRKKQLGEKLLRQQSAYLAQEKEAGEKQQALTEAQNRYRRAVIGLAARLVEEGKPCPVCGSLEHPKVAHAEEDVPDEEQLNRLQEAYEESSARLTLLHGLAAAARAELEAQGEQNRQLAEEGKRLHGEIEAFPETLADFAGQHSRAQVQEQAERYAGLVTAQTVRRQNLERLAADKAALEKECREARGKWQAVLENGGFSGEEAYLEAVLEEEARRRLSESISRYRMEAASLTELCAHMEEELKGKEETDTAPLALKRDELREEKRKGERLRTDCSIAASDAARTLRLLKAKKDDMEKREKAYGIIRDLDNMASGNNARKLVFEQYVLSGYFEDILEAANLRLRRMTGGRYELSRVEEAGDGRSKDSLEIRVMDYYTGKYRSVKTLSGGESFKASLSLALGMSDVIQAESGGIRVEALFIDEGFGALDSESLDQACSALMGLVESDRMIGIISHVPELQERISSQIFIEKKNTGSRIHS